MIYTLLTMRCESPGCIAHLDLDAVTHREARREAKRSYWVQTRHQGANIDLCSRHQQGPYPQADGAAS